MFFHVPVRRVLARLGHEQGDDVANTFYNAEPSTSRSPGTQVTTMGGTFFGAAFNSALDWDTSSVTKRANAFNQPLAWDMSSVTSMRDTFSSAVEFNQPLDWDTSKVADMVTIQRRARLGHHDECARTFQYAEELQPAAQLGHER